MGNCSCGGKTSNSTALAKSPRAASTATVMTNAAIMAQKSSSSLGAKSSKCSPSPWVPSCETQNALASCLKQVLCDFLRCVDQTLCTEGRFNFREEKLGDKLLDCVGTAMCGALECIPEALCPTTPAQPQACDDLPCDFAVEEPAQ